MASRPIEVATPDEQEPALAGTDDGPAPSTIYQIEIAVLRSQITKLEVEIENERRRRQSVVDRYERLLEER